MARSFIRYSDNGSPKWGELAGEAPKHPTDKVILYPLVSQFNTMAELVETLDAGSDLGRSAGMVEISASDILSPVTRDASIICQGLNYYDHSAGDAGIHVRKNNLIFMKASSSLCGPYDDVVRPPEVEMLDYEVEVGVVLRQPLEAGAKVGSENVGKYVAGVVLCNDVSARDTMFGATYLQWFHGKSYRTFLPAGPVFYWLEMDEVAEVFEHLKLSLSWRGEERQSSVTSQMIFKPSDTLTHLATFMDLKTGDLLLTGTPGGVIAKGTPRINEILKEHLLSDGERRPLFVIEAHATVSDFMQPGDIMTAQLVDERHGLGLGGQYTRVVE